MIPPKHQPGSFRTIKLSRIAHNAMVDLELAVGMVSIAQTGDAIQAAYSDLNEAREHLAKHISNLEFAAREQGAKGINPTVTVRYQ